MKCPFCGKEDLKVVDKRDSSELQIRRRRECNSCNKRFTTYERISEFDIYVVKKGGFKERFDKEKLKKGIILACKKRPVTLETIDNIVSEVEQALRISDKTEFDSSYVGNLVLDKLKDIDSIAYLRFASFFKNFSRVQDFKNAISEIERD